MNGRESEDGYLDVKCAEDVNERAREEETAECM